MNDGGVGGGSDRSCDGRLNGRCVHPRVHLRLPIGLLGLLRIAPWDRWDSRDGHSRYSRRRSSDTCDGWRSSSGCSRRSCASLSTEFLLHSLHRMRLCVLPQMILAIEALPTFPTNLPEINNFNQSVKSLKTPLEKSTHFRLFSAVNDKMEIEMLFAFETLHADTADVGPIGIVAQFVPLQVLLPLQSSSANVTNESTTID